MTWKVLSDNTPGFHAGSCEQSEKTLSVLDGDLWVVTGWIAYNAGVVVETVTTDRF
jgi:hypothetical protein